MVMVIVILRRKKPSHHHHQRLYDQSTTVPPPPYGRVYPIDEHDRVALIGYDSARLPTYEEATRDVASHQQVASTRSTQEFRPLPNIPFQLRSPALPSIDSTSRHSVTTTTTGNAEVFGSIDTVNFSMSDASTAGTVDTIDSRTSRPSHGSRTATAGSLESSRENLSSEGTLKLLMSVFIIITNCSLYSSSLCYPLNEYKRYPTLFLTLLTR